MELDRKTRFWIVAVPFLFVLHEAEEYLTAIPWLAEHSSLIPTAIARILPQKPAFIAYAAVGFFVLYLLVGLLAVRSKPRSITWLLLAILLAARLENAVLHSLESLVLLEYTPGVLTAVLLVLPLTIYLIRRFLQLEVISRESLFIIIPVAFVVQTIGIGLMLLLGQRHEFLVA